MTDSYDIELLINDFLRSYDVQDWVGMRNSLADDLRIDYATPRGGKPVLLPVNPDSFVRQRRNSLETMEMTHEVEVLSLWVEEDTAHSRCRFAIKRFSKDGERFFHSWGEYEFSFVNIPRRGWRIATIAQMTWRTDGNAKLYAVA
jgi:hypothetical protein